MSGTDAARPAPGGLGRRDFLAVGGAALSASLLAVVSGCSGKPQARSGGLVLNTAARPAQPALPLSASAGSRLNLKGPLSQADLDAIYRNAGTGAPAGSRPARHEPAMVNTPEFAVVADPSWDVLITREWRHIVVHHSATERGSMAVFHRAHLDRGWDGVGYHFVIGNGTESGDGEVEPTYRWRNQQQGAHAGHAEYNQHGVGICLVGDFNRQRPSPRQMSSLRALVRFLQVKTGVPTYEVVGHCEVPGRSTDCPGRNLSMTDFRASLGGGAIGVPIRYSSTASRPPQLSRTVSARSGAALP